MGPLLTQAEREDLIEGTNMDALRKQKVLVDFEKGHCLFDGLPLPQGVVQVVRGWQGLDWFVVDCSHYVCIHNI